MSVRYKSYLSLTHNSTTSTPGAIVDMSRGPPGSRVPSARRLAVHPPLSPFDVPRPIHNRRPFLRDQSDSSKFSMARGRRVAAAESFAKVGVGRFPRCSRFRLPGRASRLFELHRMHRVIRDADSSRLLVMAFCRMRGLQLSSR